LQKPTPDQPYIAGLLDPACNSKLEPNIPAEVLYDKQDDGLSPQNPWKGYHIILNPDFRYCHRAAVLHSHQSAGPAVVGYGQAHMAAHVACIHWRNK